MIVDGQLIRSGAERVAALPTTDLFEGREVLLVTDNEKYHYVDGDWSLIGDVTDQLVPPADEAGQFFVSTGSGVANWDWTSDILLDPGNNLQTAVTLNNLWIKSEFSGFDDNIFLTNQDFPTDQGFHNIVIGGYADLPAITENFDRNVMIGRNSATNQLGTSQDNVWVGYDITPDVNMSQCTFIGYQSGKDAPITSAHTIGLGYQAMSGLTFGATLGVNRSIGIGSFAGSQSDGNDNLFIGYTVGFSYDGNDKFLLGNQNATTYFDGDFAAETLTMNLALDVRDGISVGGVPLSPTLQNTETDLWQWDLQVIDTITSQFSGLALRLRANLPSTNSGNAWNANDAIDGAMAGYFIEFGHYFSRGVGIKIVDNNTDEWIIVPDTATGQISNSVLTIDGDRDAQYSDILFSSGGALAIYKNGVLTADFSTFSDLNSKTDISNRNTSGIRCVGYGDQDTTRQIGNRVLAGALTRKRWRIFAPRGRTYSVGDLRNWQLDMVLNRYYRMTGMMMCDSDSSEETFWMQAGSSFFNNENFMDVQFCVASTSFAGVVGVTNIGRQFMIDTTFRCKANGDKMFWTPQAGNGEILETTDSSNATALSDWNFFTKNLSQSPYICIEDLYQ